MIPEKLLNRNFLLLCLCNLFMSLSFFMVIPVLPLYLTEAMGASTALAGLIVALYAIAALVGRPFSGVMVDSFQRKPVFVFSTLLFMCASSGYIFAATLFALGLLRFVQGGVFSLSNTSLNTVAVENIPPAKLGTGVGIFGVLSSASMALAPMFGIYVMQNHSYRMVFICSAVLAVLSALTTLLVRCPRRTLQKRQGPLLRLDKLVLWAGLPVALVSCLSIFSYGLLTNYVSLLARDRGLESSAGTFFMCLALGMVFSRAISGWLLDRGMLDKVIIGGQLLVIAAFIWFVPGAGKFNFLSAGAALGVGFGLLMPAFQTLLIRLADKDQVGTANSTYALSMDLGIGSAALSGGILADLTSMASVYGIGAGMVLLSLLLFLTKGRKLARE